MVHKYMCTLVLKRVVKMVLRRFDFDTNNYSLVIHEL